MTQQYGYGYGQYQAYGYGQQIPIGYGVQPLQYGQQQQQQQQQRMSYPGQQVGSPQTYQQQQQVAKPPQPNVPPPPPPPGTHQASTTYYTAQQQQQQHSSPQQSQPRTPLHQPQHHVPPTHTPPAQTSYFGYQAYRPQAVAHQGMQSYYGQQHHASPTPSVGYHSSTHQPSVTTTTATVSYPSYSQTGYASAANAFYKQKQYNQPMQTPGLGQSSPAPYTPQQQRVIQQYIQQKQRPKPYTPPQKPQVYYCEICKISCASALTYQTHLEGKSHKKKIQQNEVGPPSPTAGGFTCELCNVNCTSKDAFEAHVRGAKHQKTMNLHRRLGKPIPEIKMPAITNSTTSKAAASIASREGKNVQVSMPRIMFVGGKQLSSTGAMEDSNDSVKVYPPAAAGGARQEEKEEGGDDNGGEMEEGREEADPDPVGEELVVAVTNDPTFPHSRFKCTMCDCYFNDDYAKRMHVKGRRHRLNYKKTYKPDLYVEPTNQQKKEYEKRKKFLQQRRMIRGRGGMVGGMGREPGGGPQPGVGNEDLNELRRQEAAELAKFRAHRGGPGPQVGPPGEDMGPRPPYYYEEEFHNDWGWEREPFPLPPPRNPRDDKLVLNKHSSIYPLDIELKAVQHVVGDVEKALKMISDDLLTERENNAAAEKGGFEIGKNLPKDETLRELKGVMRVGAFARGLLLRGDCAVELVLMCAEKPTVNLFNIITQRLSAKFETFDGENVYNVTPEPGKSALIVISQVGDYPIQVTITLTSTFMRDEPTAEQSLADQEEGVLDRHCCLAALAALRHTKWFQAMAHGLPSCVIVMRVLKDTCRRVPAWGVLDSWMLELLVQKCITSATPDFTKPGDVFRRVMECVASGVFLPGGVGLLDPCEKGTTDAAAALSAQERTSITLSAQHALRLIAFEKLHLVLGVDPLPPPGTPRKRPSEASNGKGEETVDGETDAKKIKLEEQ